MVGFPQYRLFPQVILQAQEEGAYLLDFNQGQFYQLDGVAHDMVSLILKGDLTTALHHCAQIYDVPPDRLQTDLEGLLAELVARRLLIPVTRDRPSNGSLSNWFASLGLPMATAIAWGGRKLLNPGAEPNGVTINLLLWLSWLSFRYLPWGTNLALWQHWHPPVLITDRDPEHIQQILTTVDRRIRENAAASFFFPMVCKERALVGYHLLRVFYHLPVQLIIGTALYPFQVHAWVTYQGQIITDDPEHCAYFDPIMTYPHESAVPS
jgi:hypothetical protein